MNKKINLNKEFVEKNKISYSYDEFEDITTYSFNIDLGNGSKITIYEFIDDPYFHITFEDYIENFYYEPCLDKINFQHFSEFINDVNADIEQLNNFDIYLKDGFIEEDTFKISSNYDNSKNEIKVKIQFYCNKDKFDDINEMFYTLNHLKTDLTSDIKYSYKDYYFDNFQLNYANTSAYNECDDNIERIILDLLKNEEPDLSYFDCAIDYNDVTFDYDKESPYRSKFISGFSKECELIKSIIEKTLEYSRQIIIKYPESLITCCLKLALIACNENYRMYKININENSESKIYFPLWFLTKALIDSKLNINTSKEFKNSFNQIYNEIKDMEGLEK